MKTFSWRTALLGKYDVFHVHWPEILVNGHSPLKKIVRQALTLGLILRLRIFRTPLVRTVHNVEVPQDISRRERLLLRLLDKATTLRIRLNSTTPIPAGEPFRTIPHGHYRDWFAPFTPQNQVSGQIGYIGLIRRYKGVEELVRAFRGTRHVADDISLRLAGNPTSEALADSIRSAAQGDNRIHLDLRFISDEDLVGVITSSELVVLPYRLMHNSAGVLTSLSLGRPVLVPDNEVNRRLSDEVGPGWVFLFEGPLTSEHLIRTLAGLRAAGPRPEPNLKGREWGSAGVDHLGAYRQAMERSRPRRPGPPA
ncbi:glycosyltransferase [Arthrobacter oryzae]|uniref:glycosyltransferase n=1 Tax=Arthrobacter oryzae TaxID=409290 RepID=UPI0027897A49|nr:glycosyltransferase [Arthrobacter oryzae]MDQ0078993.1 glycosyltransferase involved in cell wall biosynthesis [Arthrobacter oryzae]